MILDFSVKCACDVVVQRYDINKAYIEKQWIRGQ